MCLRVCVVVRACKRVCWRMGCMPNCDSVCVRCCGDACVYIAFTSACVTWLRHETDTDAYNDPIMMNLSTSRGSKGYFIPKLSICRNENWHYDILDVHL